MKTTAAPVEETLVEDESSTTSTVEAVQHNRPVQINVVATISLDFVGGGSTASKDAVLNQSSSHNITKYASLSFPFVVTAFVQTMRLQTLALPTAAT